ncbi:MAG: alanyl-tRNA editing protein [Deltaproteobacteria bacterium]|nr:alanyl-tRNA editing protein [Deltaproteobacteria bacterium]NTV56807.1 alanyl-tRNA editing protein [Deltaproteobacteria bacterium]
MNTAQMGFDSQPAQRRSTRRFYLEDDHCFEAQAKLIAVRDNSIAFDQTCFYPGGGGQPPDDGSVMLQSGEVLEIASAYSDADDIIWHLSKSQPPSGIVGLPAKLMVNKERRLALMRYHTVLHVLNTVALRDYGGWITGVQIGADYSRIDFKIEGFSAAMCTELEQKVNAVLKENHPVKSYFIPEEEFRTREDLLRTLEVKPPVSHGRVRVVEIQGFDAQACGGTHVSTTAEVGRFSVFRTENKGKINKRLYVRLVQGSDK